MLPSGKLTELMALHGRNDLIEQSFSASMHRKTAAPTFTTQIQFKYFTSVQPAIRPLIRSSMQIAHSEVQTVSMSLRMQSPQSHFQFSTAAKFPRIKFSHFKCQLTVYSLCIYCCARIVDASLSCYLTQCILLPVACFWLNIE